jgi:hypothetical protein
MQLTLIDQYYPIIKAMSANQLESELKTSQALTIKKETYSGKLIEVDYAPFDHVNTSAQIVFVGMTPGRQQMGNALRSAHQSLNSGADEETTAKVAKVFASFSGPMRSNLIKMLDHIGIARLLGLSSTDALWGNASDLVHFTSALRYPVFIDGKNYSGSPSMVNTPLLLDQLKTWFLPEMKQLRNAIFVPLGPKVAEAIYHLAPLADVPLCQILEGLPHPSGANAERIAYFLGRKPQHELSTKTNPLKLDAARNALTSKIAKIGL